MGRPRNHRTPAVLWIFYQVLIPLLQLIVAVLLVVLAKEAPNPLGVFDDLVIGIYAVALLSGAVCSFSSGVPPPISDKQRELTRLVFIVVVIVAVVLAVI